MFLLVLDKNPCMAASFVPNRLKFKQLLELCQLISSTEITDIMNPIKQGKEIQKWILKNPCFVLGYFHVLFNWCKENIKLNLETQVKLTVIEDDIERYIFAQNKKDYNIQNAIFRYVKEYTEFTEYESNSELPIDVAVEEYKKYIEWKEKQYANRIRSKKGII